MDHPLKEKYSQPEGQSPGKPRILVAPLDWGLGHATRCIPIIRELLAQNCEVWLAGEGAQENLLKTEFPQLNFLHLEGYRVQYSRSASRLLLSIFRQTHKILSAIRKENKWLKKMVAEYNFDAVISDNRYGLYHKSVPAIFITHQLAIKSPLGKLSEKILQIRNYKYINRFKECWVPDMEGENNLAGELSHPKKDPVAPVKYIGILSRLEKNEAAIKRGHLLIVLSGPEPQRTILEDKIIKEISHYNGTASIIRGLPGISSFIPSTNMIHFYNHLSAEELNKEMLLAEYVISRSGYSTVMDIVTLQKQSILIATPGQTEQEYLSKYLLQKQIALCVPQKEFSLINSLSNAKKFSYRLPAINNEQHLHRVISTFISSLARK